MAKPAASPSAKPAVPTGPVTGSPPSIEWVALDQLNIDHEYQRAADNGTSRRLIVAMIREWKWPLCQPLAVSRRDDRTLWVLDGQHRLNGARERGDIPHLPCFIVTGIAQGEEARTFVDLNTQRQKLSENDKFLGMLAAGDHYAQHLAQILRDTDWRITRDNNPERWGAGELQCAPALVKLLRQRGEHPIRFALATARAAYIDTSMRQTSTILRALIDLFPDTQRHNINSARVAQVLGATPATGWIARATLERDRLNVSREAALRMAILYECAPNLRPSAPKREVAEALPKATIIQVQSVSMTPRPAPKSPFNAEGKGWCDQCDSLVSRGKAGACPDRHCSLRQFT
ncbi:hypothetical protein FHW96_000200 [Novosphingobium sp. SG751A]|uniref:DUF6551 family protein n=1 Tax=Novosphingobium sp. SG751A TaxID=2587000 RepID=UPI0015567F96|nr:DUF6551 family protein [Novosphingobium sp. SG751A]NOW44073.1 hypothetical protein [Novosphingobium sp. SG751A]